MHFECIGHMTHGSNQNYTLNAVISIPSMQINPYQCQVVFRYLKIKTRLFLVEISASCVLYNDFSYQFQYFPYKNSWKNKTRHTDAQNLICQYVALKCFSLVLQFGSDWTIYLTKPDGSYKETSLSELLPLAFSPEHLGKI